jgi:hypothetical protein
MKVLKINEKLKLNYIETKNIHKLELFIIGRQFFDVIIWSSYNVIYYGLKINEKY